MNKVDFLECLNSNYIIESFREVDLQAALSPFSISYLRILTATGRDDYIIASFRVGNF